jgi:hypothetical protein
VKIELVGGPKCGEIVAGTPDLMPVVSVWDWRGNAVMYRRRDVSTSIKPTYGKAGHRMYEVVRHGE